MYMKKISSYLIPFLSVIILAACSDDYDDWAAPQTNGPEDPKELAFQTSVIAASVDLNTITTDSIDIVEITNITLEEGGSAQYEVYLGSDENFTEQEAIPFVVRDNKIKIAVYDLEDAVWAFYGKHGQSNLPKLRVNAILLTANGQATRVKAADMNLTVVTKTLPIESAYYLIGDPNGWNQSELLSFESLGNGIFELILTAERAGMNYKIVPQSGVDAGGQEFWDSALGTAVNEDTSKTGTLVAKRPELNEPGAIRIADAGELKITIDMNNYTYKMGPLFEMPENMFITGTPWGWKLTEGGNKQMVPINDGTGFWSIVYLAEGAEIKFFPQETSWDNGIGYPEATITAESIALADVTNEGGNLKNGNAGWYILAITVTTDGEYTIQYLEPQVWLVGPTSTGGWDNIASNPADLFSIPADADGEFVSPAFLASENLRMAVTLPGIPWWQTEFNVFDGKIVYRGKGNDLDAVPVQEGQKVYLKFSDDTGRVQ